METLLIFDIDGTLLRSTELQMACLENALLAVFGGQLTLWGNKEPRSTTDSGILAEIARDLWGRAPLPADEARFRAIFLAEMNVALTRGANLTQTPGAAFAITGDCAPRRAAVAIATGGFESVSKLKADHAGLSINSLPAAFAEDGFMKEQVLCVSLHRAESHYGTKFKKVVYVGDACYDARAANRLGFMFVGVGSGTRVQRLLDCGASVTVPDLTHLSRVLSGGGSVLE
jgi:phosphoglycolate phosphatase-like HAD superfamily hydrolase